MSFGLWLRQHRLDADLTLKELAKRCGLSFSYISALEREQPHSITGKDITPKLDTVDTLAKALGKPVDEARLAAGYAPKTSIHFVNGFRIELPGDVEVMLAKSDDVRTQADADEFKEAFMVAYATVKARLARDRDDE